MNSIKKKNNQNRNVCLFLDSAACHPQTITLINVKLIFLPPNGTSACQLLDQGS